MPDTQHVEETPSDWAFPKFIGPRIPGVNVDHIDVDAGLRTLEGLGWSPIADPHTFMVITYALQRWARGEEAEAERLAIAQGETDPTLKAAAIDYTSWRVVLASAMSAGAEAARERESAEVTS